jgi:hypothetical protein
MAKPSKTLYLSINALNYSKFILSEFVISFNPKDYDLGN